MKGIELAMDGGSPHVLEFPVTAGQTFKKGAPVTLQSTGLLSESATDPDAANGGVTGVALEGAFRRPGNLMGMGITQITGSNDKISVAMANSKNIFVSHGVTGGTTMATPTQTMVDTQFGLLKSGLATGYWDVDIDETTELVVEIVKVDIDNKLFYWKFLDAVANLPT